MRLVKATTALYSSQFLLSSSGLVNSRYRYIPRASIWNSERNWKSGINYAFEWNGHHPNPIADIDRKNKEDLVITLSTLPTPEEFVGTFFNLNELTHHAHASLRYFQALKVSRNPHAGKYNIEVTNRPIKTLRQAIKVSFCLSCLRATCSWTYISETGRSCKLKRGNIVERWDDKEYIIQFNISTVIHK